MLKCIPIWSKSYSHVIFTPVLFTGLNHSNFTSDISSSTYFDSKSVHYLVRNWYEYVRLFQNSYSIIIDINYLKSSIELTS